MNAMFTETEVMKLIFITSQTRHIQPGNRSQDHPSLYHQILLFKLLVRMEEHNSLFHHIFLRYNQQPKRSRHASSFNPYEKNVTLLHSNYETQNSGKSSQCFIFRRPSYFILQSVYIYIYKFQNILHPSSKYVETFNSRIST